MRETLEIYRCGNVKVFSVVLTDIMYTHIFLSKNLNQKMSRSDVKKFLTSHGNGTFINAFNLEPNLSLQHPVSSITFYLFKNQRVLLVKQFVLGPRIE
jgi:hypothetical protein